MYPFINFLKTLRKQLRVWTKDGAWEHGHKIISYTFLSAPLCASCTGRQVEHRTCGAYHSLCSNSFFFCFSQMFASTLHVSACEWVSKNRTYNASRMLADEGYMSVRWLVRNARASQCTTRNSSYGAFHSRCSGPSLNTFFIIICIFTPSLALQLWKW